MFFNQTFTMFSVCKEEGTKSISSICILEMNVSYMNLSMVECSMYKEWYHVHCRCLIPFRRLHGFPTVNGCAHLQTSHAAELAMSQHD